MEKDKPDQTFHNLINQFDRAANDDYVSGISKYELGPDCKKVRLVAGTVVIDIYWYPLSEKEHRDWYDVTISSVKESAHFTGKLDEFGESKKIFEEILATGNIKSSKI